MADPRTFVLIGDFRDNISPALEKINNNISRLKGNLSDLQNVTKPLKKDFRQLASLSNNFSSSLKSQASDIKDITAAMRAMRNEMGRVNRAYRAAGRNRNIVPPPPPPPRVPRGAVPPPPPPPRTPRVTPFSPEPSAPAGGRRYAAAAGAVAGGSVIGMQLASVMENAIVSGFQIGTKIMMAPFEFFANRLQERIKDELSDIQAAGGLLAVARRQKEPFVKDFAESMRFTQQMNKRFAEIAAALPGSTQEYVEVGKRLGDTAGRIVANDVGKAIKEANVLRAARGEAAITGTGRKSQQTAIQEILGELTTKTVLAGLGSGGAGGAGRNLGPYGLPGLTERLIGQEQVSMGQFQRYSAIFRDPAIMQALDRFIPQINAAQKDSIERFQILKRMYDEILPPEVIRAYERSFAGLMEIYNTAFFNPEKGIFGLGRKMQGLGPAMDDMGRYIKILEDGTVKVVESVKEASKADLSVFDMFRDITANIGLVLGPIVNNLTVLFDPMKKIGNLLVQARIESGRFLFAFESYRKGLADMVKNMPKDRMEKFSQIPVDLRASLAAINNLFRKFGVIDMKDFEANAKKIMSDEFDVAAMMKGFFNTFLNSKIAKNVGETVGMVIGTVLSEVANLMRQFMGITQASGIVEGLKKGFDSAGGVKAVKDIISMVFQGILNLVLTVIKTAPVESAIIAGLFMLPSVLAGVITSAVTAVFTGGMPFLMAAFKKMVLGLFRVKPVAVKDMGAAGPITDPRRMLPAARTARAALPGTEMIAKAAKGGWFANLLTNLKNLGRLLTTPVKAFGKFNVALMALTGAIEFVSTLLSGGNIAEALGKAAGPAIGMAIGAALLGPLGAMIGGWLGSLKPVTDSLTGIFQGIWWGLTEAWAAIGPVLDGIGGILVTVFNGLVGLIPGLDGLAANFDFLNFAFIAIKVALFPFVSAINGVGFALQALKLGLLHFDKWVNSTFQFGDRQGRIQAEIDKTNAQIYKIAENQNRLNQSLLKPLPAQKPAVPGAAKPTTTPAAAAAAPAKPVGTPVVAAASPKLEAASSVTATNTQALNNKASTQIAHAAATRQTATQTTKNTTTANNILTSIKSGIIAVSNRIGALQTAMLGDLNNIQSGVNKISSLLASGNLKVKTDMPAFPGMMPGGPPMGGAQGSLGAAQQLASANGLQMTSWFRPGDPGMHGAGRAMDFSNGVNTPQQMAFAQQMIARYGSSLSELIYTPLGFGIKNGRKVPLSFWGPRTNAMHYNHVHVAFAEGKESGRMFTSQQAAGGWENSMVPGSVKIASVTANSGDGGGFGALTIGDINLTVHAGGVSDPDQLASIVALKIGEAVSDARASSIFV